jgi:hypothetical protein
MTQQNPNEEPFEVEEEQFASTPPAPVSDNDKLLAGLSYVSQLIVPAVFPIILLLTDESKRSAFIKHHAVTSLALLVASVAYEIVAGIVYAIIGVILPFLTCILWVIFLLPLVPLIYYGVQAFQGKMVEVPYLSKFLRDQNWL